MIRIEKALVSDAMCLSEIYAPYVRETAITFEYEPPSAEEFAERMRTIIEDILILRQWMRMAQLSDTHTHLPSRRGRHMTGLLRYQYM